MPAESAHEAYILHELAFCASCVCWQGGFMMQDHLLESPRGLACQELSTVIAAPSPRLGALDTVWLKC